MNQEILEKSLAIAAKTKHLFVATADSKGIPHLATAEKISRKDDELVTVTAWFCPKTAENVSENPNIALIVWDGDQDLGFQLIGKVEKVVNLAMLNGFLPGETTPYPQIERKLVVRLEQIFNFSHAPLSDMDAL